MDWNQLVADAVFYAFSAVTVISALGVITMRNAVHSVLLLVLTFFSAAGLFVLLGAEFLAAILVIVYMGAVAILFLFVVMMMDLDFAELRQGAVKYLPAGIVVGALILVELVAIGYSIHGDHQPVVAEEAVHNTLAIGRVLYTKFLYPFEMASIILLVALIGAIALTHRRRHSARRQSIPDQLARRREDAVEMKQVASGEGAQPK